MKKGPDLNREELVARYEKQSMDKVWPIFWQYRSLLFAATGTMIIFNMIGLTMPWMLKIAIDRILPNADYVLFWILSGSMIIIYLMRMLLRYVASYLVDYTGIRLIVDIRQKVFRHLQSLSLKFYEEYRTGKLISNVISDVGLLNMLMRVISQAGEQVFQLMLIALLLLFLNWQMGLLVLCTIPIHYLNFRHFRKIRLSSPKHPFQKLQVQIETVQRISDLMRHSGRQHGNQFAAFGFRPGCGTHIVLGDVVENHGDAVGLRMGNQVESENAPFGIEHFQLMTLGAPLLFEQSLPVHPFQKRRDGKTRHVIGDSQHPGRGAVPILDFQTLVNDHDPFADGVEDVFQKPLLLRQFVDSGIEIARVHVVHMFDDLFRCRRHVTPFFFSRQ